MGSTLSGQVLVIDNYDLFTFNLVQYLRELGATVASSATTRCRSRTSRDRTGGDRDVPGPRIPEEAGVCVDLVRTLGSTVPMLGVCLGHQAIGVAYGATVVRAPCGGAWQGRRRASHGAGVLRGLDDPFMATRYHSLIVATAGPAGRARGDRLERRRPDHGHAPPRFPSRACNSIRSSIGTPAGHALLRNFLDTAGHRCRRERLRERRRRRARRHCGGASAPRSSSCAARRRRSGRKRSCCRPRVASTECAARRDDHRGDEAAFAERRRAPARAGPASTSDGIRGVRGCGNLGAHRRARLRRIAG